MKTNNFFFRDSYRPEEKIDRIPSDRINPSDDGFCDAVRAFEYDPSEFSNTNKGDFFHRLNEDLGDDEFDEFVDLLFENCGQKGDKFNVQIFSLPENNDYQNITTPAEEAEGERLDNKYSVLSRALLLDEVDQEDDHVDLAFKTTEEREDIEPSDELPVVIERADTGEEEETYGPEYIVRAPSRKRIEARTYTNENLVAISNSTEITRGLQKDIATIITQFAREGGRGELNE